MIISMLLFSMHSAPAGEVFQIEAGAYNIYAFEARMPAVQWRSASTYLFYLPEVPMLESLAYDKVSDEVYTAFLFSNSRGIRKKNPYASSWVSVGSTGSDTPESLTFDPQVGVLGFMYYQGVWPSAYQAPGHALYGGGADYVDQLGIHVVTDGTDLYGFLPGLLPWVLAPFPQGMIVFPDSAGYDSDLQIFWVADTFGPNIDGEGYDPVLGFNPETWEVVAKMFLPGSIGLGGSRDNVPFQLPTLLVTGDCPGTMYVTLADGTPGGEAVFVSGVVEGSRTVRGGPCAGTTAGLANPREQARLTIGGNGLASTSFVSTPEQCGVLKIQALDAATCTPTEVRTVETAVVPWDRPRGYY